MTKQFKVNITANTIVPVNYGETLKADDEGIDCGVDCSSSHLRYNSKNDIVVKTQKHAEQFVIQYINQVGCVCDVISKDDVVCKSETEVEE